MMKKPTHPDERMGDVGLGANHCPRRHVKPDGSGVGKDGSQNIDHFVAAPALVDGRLRQVYDAEEGYHWERD